MWASVNSKSKRRVKQIEEIEKWHAFLYTVNRGVNKSQIPANFTILKRSYYQLKFQQNANT